MIRRTAIISYARMPEDSLRELRDGLSDLSIDIAAVASHTGGEGGVQRVVPYAVHYVWGAYRYDIPWIEPFDHELYETLLAPDKATALPLVERYGPFEGGSMEAENRAAHDFSRANRILNEHSPDLVLFAKNLESGLEYMLYILARHYGVQTLMTRRGIFGHSRVVSTSFEDPILAEDWKPHASTIPLCNLDTLNEKYHPETSKEINRIRSLGDAYVPEYVHGKTDGRHWGDTLKVLAKQSRSPRRLLRSVLDRADGPIFKKRLYDRYVRLATSDIEPAVGPSIFFPLHYQPEATTMPLGGPFVNQIKAVKLLSDALPEKGRIYVKEHPSIFGTRTKTNRNYRSAGYYDWLVKIPKVIMVGLEVPSAYLQGSVDFTACITGSAGLEAMIRGHKVLVFGNATYLNGPGVYSAKNLNSLTLFESGMDDRSPDWNVASQFVQAVDSISWHIPSVPRNPDELAWTMQTFYKDALLAGLAQLHENGRFSSIVSNQSSTNQNGCG